MTKLLRLLLLLAVIAAAIYGARALFFRGPAAGDVYPGYGEGELVYVAAPIGGEVVKLPVRRGDPVPAGALMFELDRTQELAARAEAEETLRQTRTEFDKAKLDFDRAKTLRDKRVTAPEDYDHAVQALLAAQHAAAARQRALEQADWRYAQKQQTAPGGGVVYDTYFRVGEWVPEGKPVLSLLLPEYRKVRFFVPERDLGKVQPGTPIEIHLDGLPAPLPGKVSFVSPEAEYTLPIIYSRENREKLVFLVEGSLNPEDARLIHPGAPVEVRLANDRMTSRAKQDSLPAGSPAGVEQSGNKPE
ncbi:MAG TPA: efflux RND transporter periplasmic adaptor subunit [Chthoniobacterales bacterium]